MILSRTLTKQEYGTYSQGVLIINFCAPFLLMGMSNAVAYFKGQKDLNQDKYVNTIFTMTLISGIFGVMVLNLFRGSIIDYFQNTQLASLICYIAIRPLLLNIITVFQTLFIACNMASLIVIRNLLVSIIQIIIIFLGAVIFHSIKSIFILLIIMDAIQILLFFLLYWNSDNKLSFSGLDWTIMRQVLAYSIPLGFSMMLGTLTVYMDKLIVGRLTNTEEFAIFSNMSKELPFTFITVAFTTVITPVLYKLRADNNNMFIKVWHNYLKFGYTTTWILCGGGIVCAPELLRFLYSEKYEVGLPIFIIYLMVTCCRFTYFGAVLSAYGKTKWILWFSIFTLILNSLLNIVLFRYFGMVGPAVATLIVIFASGVFQLLASCRLVKVSFTQIMDLPRLIVLIVECIAVGFIYILIKQRLYLPSVAKLFIIYPSFVLTLFILQRKQIISTLNFLNQVR